ncbi:hypothetical protein D3C71_1839520 [compost metagenome]
MAGEHGNRVAVPAVGAESDRFDPAHGSAQSQWRCGVGIDGHVQFVAVDDLVVTDTGRWRKPADADVYRTAAGVAGRYWCGAGAGPQCHSRQCAAGDLYGVADAVGVRRVIYLAGVY